MDSLKKQGEKINGEGSFASLRCLEMLEMLSYLGHKRRQRTWHSDTEAVDLPRKLLSL